MTPRQRALAWEYLDRAYRTGRLNVWTAAYRLRPRCGITYAEARQVVADWVKDQAGRADPAGERKEK